MQYTDDTNPESLTIRYSASDDIEMYPKPESSTGSHSDSLEVLPPERKTARLWGNQK